MFTRDSARRAIDNSGSIKVWLPVRDPAQADAHEEVVCLDQSELGYAVIASVPVMARGYSLGDGVTVDDANEVWVAGEVVKGSGHRTARVTVRSGHSNLLVAIQDWLVAERRGYQVGGVDVIAFDVPPEEEIAIPRSLASPDAVHVEELSRHVDPATAIEEPAWLSMQASKNLVVQMADADPPLWIAMAEVRCRGEDHEFPPESVGGFVNLMARASSVNAFVSSLSGHINSVLGSGVDLVKVEEAEELTTRIDRNRALGPTERAAAVRVLRTSRPAVASIHVFS